MKWILASASPRRKELLRELIPEFEIIPSRAEEIVEGAPPPEQLVQLLAKQKAEDVAKTPEAAGKAVLGSDTVVALDGEIAVGYVGYLGIIDEYEITNVATHPDYRRLGIGSALIGALVEKAERNGILRITLDVRESNAPAIALYEKFGFAPCGKRKSFYSNPREDALVMEWKPNQ